ncbi:inositol monophosphatase family protein [Corynebacterium sp. 11A]|uniref:inositol monophosphatase family protein n=1 Tax=Corynebacterium sp. 11A TaxID=2080510 RepID=UPI00124BF481|nr:inositol monophosphatase family protein [Corynebacterium sp. 11A]
MVDMSSLAEMISSVTSTFVVAQQDRSDEQLAQALVYNASRLAWRMREVGITTERKTSVSDVVTEADRAAESFVSDALKALRPEDGVRGEEGSSRESDSGRYWVIDPIDGTFNFSRGSDYWCSALALVSGTPDEPEQVHFGAVHRPDMGYTWFGGPEIPTTRDGKSLPPLSDADISTIPLATYLHPTYVGNAEVAGAWQAVAQLPSTIRMWGAGSVDLASVADGTMGAWMQHSVPCWDWLPGRALVEGSGGATAQVEAGGVTWSIAGNAQAVEQIRAALES